jgi:uncharacterized protein YaaN involved in tellurite resistance
MTEPRGLNLGQAKPVQPAPYVSPLTVASSAPTQQLAPITIQEAGEIGKSSAMAAAGIATKITSIARAGDIDEVGKCLNGLMITAKKYDPSNLKKGGGFLGFFKVKVQELKNQFATVDNQVDQLLAETNRHVGLFKGRIGDLEALYVENEAKYHELGRVIAEVEARIGWMEANRPAVEPNNNFSAQRYADWNTAIDYASKRVDDLRRGQDLCVLQGPQIKIMQTNSGSLVQKFDQISTDVIPALKTAFALYILNMEQEKGADFAKSVDDLSNQTHAANAAKLGVTTVKVQTALARSSIDLSTLQTMQAATLKSLDDVQRIRSEMKMRLDQERPQLEALTQQLTQRLAQPA